MMDYQKLAQELLNSDKPVMLTSVQLSMLQAEVEALPEDEQCMLEQDGEDNPSIQRTMLIRELAENERLMVILSLGKIPIEELINCLAYFVNGNFEFEIQKNEEGYVGSFFSYDDEGSESEMILSFFDASVPYGTPTPSEEDDDIFIDEIGVPIAEIYYDMLDANEKKMTDAKWLKIASPNFGTSTPTNDYLLQFILARTDEENIEVFSKELYDSIAEYFTFWLGPNYRDYADRSDF